MTNNDDNGGKKKEDRGCLQIREGGKFKMKMKLR